MNGKHIIGTQFLKENSYWMDGVPWNIGSKVSTCWMEFPVLNLHYHHTFKHKYWYNHYIVNNHFPYVVYKSYNFLLLGTIGGEETVYVKDFLQTWPCKVWVRSEDKELNGVHPASLGGIRGIDLMACLSVYFFLYDFSCSQSLSLYSAFAIQPILLAPPPPIGVSLEGE